MSDTPETRPCTCHPDDMTPPCERKYAYTDCKIQRLERERDAARAERDVAIKQMQAGWIEVCETPIADLMRERDEAREALRDLREECKKEGWLLHASKAPVMDRARAILGRAGGE